LPAAGALDGRAERPECRRRPPADALALPRVDDRAAGPRGPLSSGVAAAARDRRPGPAARAGPRDAAVARDRPRPAPPPPLPGVQRVRVRPPAAGAAAR